MVKKFIGLALFFIISFSVPVRSAQELELTLEKSLDHAEENNRTLQAARENIAEAGKGFLGAVGNFLPSVSASGNFTRLDEPMTLTRALPGTYEDTDSYTLTGTVRLPLFTGFRNSAIYSSSRLNLKIQNENHRKELNDLRFRVTEAFYRCLLSEKLVELNEKSEERLEKHLQQTRKLYENGLASRLDMLRAEVQLSNIRPKIIEVQNNLRTSRDTLFFLIGLEKDNRDIVIDGELNYRKVDANLEESLKRGLISRPDLKILKLREEAAVKNITIARSAGMPQVSASYNQRMEHPYRYEDKWGDSWNVMVNVSLPIFRGFSTYAEVSQAKSARKRVELNIQQVKENIRLEIENAYYTLLKEEETIQALDKNFEQAEKALDIAQTRYSNGLITNLEFMDTEISYMEARINLLKAKADYIIAASRLEKAAGGK